MWRTTAPHDYQAVLEVRLADGRQDRALRSRLAGKPVLWTVSPEKFTLANVAEGFRFKADVVLCKDAAREGDVLPRH